MLKTGYVKLWRKLKQWEWFHDTLLVGAFVKMILLANHIDKKWQGIVIPRGSFVSSWQHLSQSLNLSLRQTRTVVDKLKSTSELTKQPTSRFTLFTLVNYDKYQNSSLRPTMETTSPRANERQTNDKQATTTKECKEYKEREEEGESPMGLSSLASLWNEICKSLSPVRYVSSNRQRKEQLRLRERDEKGWREVFQKIETSSFCRGENERGWRASYDWIIANPDNALKVLERKYDDHDSRNSRREKLLEELRNIP